MRKFKKIFVAFFILLLILSVSTTKITYAEKGESDYYVGGFTVGFSIDKRGATIAGLSDVLTNNGIASPSRDAGLIEGDVILEIDNQEINNAKDIEKTVQNSKSKLITVKRESEIKVLRISPALDSSGKYKLGILIKENITGIGTVTYVKDGYFASLGHPILDEFNSVMQITGGKIYNCNIIDYVKGEKGCPGELKGITDSSASIGKLQYNKLNGAYGIIDKNSLRVKLEKIKTGEGIVGKAYIRSNIYNNEMNDYEIMIVKADNNESHYKNYVIKITDERLLNLTGGIVQGMSGSPIIQNGKLIGAVTHVFVNDPKRGFGISINNMNIDK